MITAPELTLISQRSELNTFETPIGTSLFSVYSSSSYRAPFTDNTALSQPNGNSEKVKPFKSSNQNEPFGINSIRSFAESSTALPPLLLIKLSK